MRFAEIKNKSYVNPRLTDTKTIRVVLNFKVLCEICDHFPMQCEMTCIVRLTNKRHTCVKVHTGKFVCKIQGLFKDF